MKVVIIEDEKRTAQNLQMMIKTIAPDFEIVTIIQSVEESIEWFANNNCDLVFMDIQLSDGISFEIFTDVEIQAPIIFTTSYNEYALKAFEVNGIDYLLKPIEPSKLEKSIQKFRRFNQNKVTNIYDLQNLLKDLSFEKKQYKKRFLVKSGSTLIAISTDDIAYFCIENENVYLITQNSKKFIIDFTLDEIEKILDPNYFFRLNRQFIASILSIGLLHPYSNNTLKVELKPVIDKEVIVSRYNIKEFKHWLER